MTEKEAIEILDNERPHCGKKVTYAEGGIYEAYSMAIKALEKRVPDYPALEGDGYDEDGEIIFDEWLCPGCGTRYEADYDEYKGSSGCLQRAGAAVGRGGQRRDIRYYPAEEGKIGETTGEVMAW